MEERRRREPAFTLGCRKLGRKAGWSTETCVSFVAPSRVCIVCVVESKSRVNLGEDGWRITRFRCGGYGDFFCSGTAAGWIQVSRVDKQGRRELLYFRYVHFFCHNCEFSNSFEVSI
jgi:hypothetical protein